VNLKLTGIFTYYDVVSSLNLMDIYVPALALNEFLEGQMLSIWGERATSRPRLRITNIAAIMIKIAKS